MIHQINDLFATLDGYIGGAQWFVFLLLGTGVFFTLYLGFPQIRYFSHALKVITGRFDKDGDTGDTSHFQALTTALSGTVGTGNIAGVALAIFLGGPAALFWMLVTAFLGMTTKFVEVTLSHKYRDILPDGSVSGGPMYFMKKRLNISLPNGKLLKTGYLLGGIFAVATIFSSFGTGSLPQVNSIASAMFASFGIQPIVTGGILAVILALVILGGIKRIALVTAKLVPAMALIYFVGALSVILYNFDQIIPSFVSIFSDVFSGTAATGGFLGASFSFAFNRGVNRGLFSNEAGQGSAPIAHAAARAHEPVSEGIVAILEPFIDTIIICSLTGLVILSSGVWTEKHENMFQSADTEILVGSYSDVLEVDQLKLAEHISGEERISDFTGSLIVADGRIDLTHFTFIHARSVAENILVTNTKSGKPFTGMIPVKSGLVNFEKTGITVVGVSLLHSATLTTMAFEKGFFGHNGQYIVAIGLLLFAFSTSISWSYYGERAVLYLLGATWV
ncbi:MAG: hypothetical protein RIS47_1745, partial [Bacteroidota bacterium]